MTLRPLLTISALGVFVAGFVHAALVHRGYGDVEIIGPLFLLNGIASAAVVLLLVFDRPRLFVLGALAIAVPSLIAIGVSHFGSLFGWQEGEFDEGALVIVGAEIVAAVFALVGLREARRA